MYGLEIEMSGRHPPTRQTLAGKQALCFFLLFFWGVGGAWYDDDDGSKIHPAIRWTRRVVGEIRDAFVALVAVLDAASWILGSWLLLDKFATDWCGR